LPVKLEIRSFPVAGNRGLYLWTFAALVVTGLASVPLAAQPAPPAPPSRFVVVLDAAHGGDDNGGRLANNQLEKSFTLALSVRLRSLLAARGIQVVTTRESDMTVEPDKRAEIANRADAQACLSLHATASGSGVYLFASSLAPAAPARFAAWKTAQAAWVTRSLKLEGVLNSALLQAGMSVTMSRTSVTAMDSMTCPAVAVEIAPEQKSGEETTGGLNDKDYQARVAAALAAALLEWRTDAGRTEGQQP